MSGNFFDEPADHVPVPVAPYLGPPPRRAYAVASLHNGIRRVAAGRRALRSECWSLTRFMSDGSLTEEEIRDCMIAAARAANIPIREACLTIDSAIRSKRGR
jgi:hypothetical protein